MYYIEFYERRHGVAVEEFHRRTINGFPEWSRRYPADELVLNIGRTWRMGPYPYLLVWGCSAFERLDVWDEVFRSSEVDDLEYPIFEVMNTFTAGVYRDVDAPLPRASAHWFYLETFKPWKGSGDSYRQRARDAGRALTLLIERVGLLGPDPGGIAIFALDVLADAQVLAESTPSEAMQAGTYAVLGEEIL